ncbi:MAG: glycosyltransferase [Nostocaceae cyanobacterium]|nr:glycosyltransferase [Nostocaceae cyanobacterium]
MTDLTMINQVKPEVILGNKTSQPLVSIIVNNYNYAQFLSESINSALQQTYRNIEIIVVDDGSQDNSREILAKYGNKIIPIGKQNGGQASAFNAGFMVSHGEIIIFLDADDYLFPETVEQVVSAWNSQLAKVQYRLQMVDISGDNIGIYPPPERNLDSGNVLSTLLTKGRYGTPVTSGNAFSRAVLEKIFPIPEAEFRLSADGYVVNQVPFYGEILSIEQPLAAYRIHGNNLWAYSQKVDTERFAKYVNHDLQRYQLLASKAADLGYKITQDFSNRDYIHLRYRLISLRLQPEHHPVSTDKPLELTFKAWGAIWLYSDLNLFNKLSLSWWFITMGILPQPISQLLLTWLMFKGTRPKFIAQAIQTVKAVKTKVRVFTKLAMSN